VLPHILIFIATIKDFIQNEALLENDISLFGLLPSEIAYSSLAVNEGNL